LSSFVRLVQNEQMKIYNRARTWVMLGILALTVILYAVLFKYVMESGMNSALPFMSMTAGLSFLVFVFSVIVAGDSVASEFTWGTIKLLLIRPATRAKILAAKYVSVLLFLITALAALFVVSYFVGLIFFGLGGSPGEAGSFPRIVQTYGIKFVDLLMFVTLAFMISTVFRSSSLAIGLSIFLMFTANGVVLMLAGLKYNWVKYTLFANTDLSPYLLGDEPLVKGMTLGFSVTMLAVYWIVMYAVSWLLFTKRDVAG